jgi:hypothetical protein
VRADKCLGGDDLIVNGDFASGDFAPGWETTGDNNVYVSTLDGFGITAAGLPPRYRNASETEAAFLGAVGAVTVGVNGTMSQLINGTQPGCPYRLSFYLRDGTEPEESYTNGTNPFTPNTLAVYIDGVSLDINGVYFNSSSGTTAAFSIPCTDCPPFDVFTELSAVVAPTQTSALLQFVAQNDPDYFDVTLVKFKPACAENGPKN